MISNILGSRFLLTEFFFIFFTVLGIKHISPQSNVQNATAVNAKRDDSDGALVQKAQAGSQEAFRLLVERYEGKVAGVVYGMLGRGPEAEDAGQETFIRFYRSLAKFRGDAQLGTYLSRIAVNVSLDALKKRKRSFQEIGVEEAAPELKKVGTDDFRARQEAKELVYLALSKLDPGFRSVITLRMLQGYSTKETAEILEIPLGTVLSRLKRGQEQLKTALQSLMKA